MRIQGAGFPIPVGRAASRVMRQAPPPRARRRAHAIPSRSAPPPRPLADQRRPSAPAGPRRFSASQKSDEQTRRGRRGPGAGIGRLSRLRQPVPPGCCDGRRQPLVLTTPAAHDPQGRVWKASAEPAGGSGACVEEGWRPSTAAAAAA